MKIAVTAASGKLGVSIINNLKQKINNDDIVGIARTPENAKGLGIEIRKGDYNNKKEFDHALEGIDTLLLISGMDSPDNRIVQHRNVIEAARDNGVKKIVYTSIIGNPDNTDFSPIVKSNRVTESDLTSSGLQWAIGRNSIYIEPDVEYIDNYIKEGEIRNCARDGRCTYTSRDELGLAYSNLLLNNELNNDIYNLSGHPTTQTELAELLSNAYNTKLIYKSLSVEEYRKDRQEELGEFIGSIITGIYESISKGYYDVESDFEKVTGRAHKSLKEIIEEIK